MFPAEGTIPTDIRMQKLFKGLRRPEYSRSMIRGMTEKSFSVQMEKISGHGHTMV